MNCDKLVFSTPLEGKSVSEVYNKMVAYYNEHYETAYEFSSSDLQLENCRYVEGVSAFMKTKKIYPKGFIGCVNNSFILNSDFLEIGVGKYNCIGGGQIEITTNI